MRRIDLTGPMNSNRVNYSEIRCPGCGSSIRMQSVIVANWPYLHTDIIADCIRGCWKGTFGIPMSHRDGMELYLYGAEAPEPEDLKGFLHIPLCPFHTIKMEITKILKIGVKLFLIQHKCSICYLTHSQSLAQRDDGTYAKGQVDVEYTPGIT